MAALLNSTIRTGRTLRTPLKGCVRNVRFVRGLSGPDMAGHSGQMSEMSEMSDCVWGRP